MRSHDLGQEGEAFALEFLKELGYVILDQNFRAKAGEIDIIARDGEFVVFIEVKTRQEDGWDAFEAVHRTKQRHMARAALEYLVTTFQREDIAARFDVLAVTQDAQGRLTGEILKNAFSL